MDGLIGLFHRAHAFKARSTIFANILVNRHRCYSFFFAVVSTEDFIRALGLRQCFCWVPFVLSNAGSMPQYQRQQPHLRNAYSLA
jgi:hypothetical protein